MVDRRIFLAGTNVVFLSALLAGWAQQQAGVYRIGLTIPQSLLGRADEVIE